MKVSLAIPIPVGAGRIPSFIVVPGILMYTPINISESPIRPLRHDAGAVCRASSTSSSAGFHDRSEPRCATMSSFGYREII